MEVERHLNRLRSHRSWRDQIVHVEGIAARAARYAEPESPLPGQVQAILSQTGIERLYVHQAQAVDLARQGADFVVVTGTASGKTLCYNLPIFERLVHEPEACALYLFPTKALSQDQLRGVVRALGNLGRERIIAGTYDGDTSPDMRRKLRNDGQLIFTNPDMLHAGILPNHSRWARFFEKLRYVVIDEIHAYRGVFGSHVGGVLRRFGRICAHYDVHPQYLCSSATIANPAELAEGLTGRGMKLIDDDGSPRGPKSFVLWNPPFVDDERIERRSPLTEAQHLMASLIEERVQTIAFVRARVMAELLYRFVQETLSHQNVTLARRIRAYRGGYLPEERRAIERQLFEGELLGVVSTNALELGIDIGSLEACLLVGYPGTIASTWQQAGRAGRGSEPSLVVLIGQNTPIDQYLMNHGDYLFGRSPEHAIIDPTNPHVAIGHLRCAAHELPIGADEAADLFGEFTPAMLELLTEERHLKQIGSRWHYSQSTYPAAQLALRNIDDQTYTIQESTERDEGGDTEGARVIGTLDEISAFTQAHTHAIYLHDGETYFVDKLDVDERIAYVRREGLDYFTQAISESAITLNATEREDTWRISRIGFGDVTVSVNVVMFKKIKFGSRDSIGYENLDLPTRTLDTTALWVVPPQSSLVLCRQWGRVPAEGLKGIVNILVEVIPLFVMGDTQDIGGVVDSSNLGRPALFIYDKYPGGIGFAEKAFDWVEQIMTTALELISECPCRDGCPSCVGAALPMSAKDGPHDRDLVPDKDAALILLHDMLQREPYTPKERRPPVLAEDAPAKTPAAERPSPPIKPLPPMVEAKVRTRVQQMRRKKER